MSMCSQMLLHLLPALRACSSFDALWLHTLELFANVHRVLSGDAVRRDTVSAILRNMVLILQSSGVFHDPASPVALSSSSSVTPRGNDVDTAFFGDVPPASGPLWERTLQVRDSCVFASCAR
jgi:hypothetical protein